MGVVKLADYRHNPVQHQEASSMGYVSIHRQFMDSRLYKDSQAVHLWLHLILKANHESTVVNTDIGPITVDRGQMITGRPSLVRETFIPDNKVRSLLRTFESKGMLNICSMGKKFSLFTIVKYDDFQAKNCPTVVQRLSNANTSNGAALSGDCPTVVQRLSINNNINNISNTDVLESSGNKTSAQRATTAPTETSPFSGDAAAATNPAVHAAEARVAQGVPMTPATRNPEEVVRTVAAQKRPNLASSLDELDINPQAEVLESAERLNVDSLLPSHFSGNEQYKAVEQAIKSRAGSALQVQENEAIRQLAQGAGEIIDRVSGAKDALGMSDKFIDTVNGRMSALMKRSDQLYRNVEKAMPAGAKIDAPSTRSMLKQVAEDLGGMKNLDPIEKRVFRAVNPGKNGALTYANLNKQRRLVGDALHKNSGPYKDADRAALSRLYGSLADDQKAALSETNALRDFEVAQRLVQMRKSMEEQMINLTGRTLNGDISRKATTALQAMSKGDAKGFRELMQNTPSRKLRTELLGTGLRDMLSNGKRGADFNPAGFADWYQNMLANGQMRNLARHLPKETMSGLNDVYKVAKAIKDAKSYEITTGRLNEFVKRFNRVTAANEFVANHAQRIGTAVGSTVSGPFSAVGAVAGSEIGAKVASKIRAMGGAESIESAEKLISSPEFQKAARLAVKQAPESIVDTTVRRSSAWRSFYNSLPESDKKTISRLGIMYWMNSDDNQK